MPAIIDLSDGTVGLIDEDNFERISALGPWHVGNRKKTPTIVAYIKGSCVGGTPARQYRLSYLVIGTPPVGHVVDHIDRDPRNNTRENLRFASRKQNAMNKRSKRKAWKGVYRSGNYYCAKISRDGLIVNSALYDSAEKAAAAYNELAERLFGEFAGLNPVNPHVAALVGAIDDVRAMQRDRLNRARSILELLEDKELEDKE